jgi:hypothetical protein
MACEAGKIDPMEPARSATRRDKRGAGRPLFLVRRSRGEAGWFLSFGQEKNAAIKNWNF